MSIALVGRVVNGKAAAKAMQQSHDLLHAEQRKIVGRQVAFVERYLKLALTSPGLPGPHSRTGAYRRSIRSRVIAGLNDVTGIVGTRSIYALIHEYGHPGIEPVRRKWLTIPTRFAKSGRTRTLSARAIGGLHFEPTRRADLARLVNQAGDVVFWLVKRSPRSGRFPKRPMWVPAVRAVRKRMQKMLPRKLDGKLREAVSKAPRLRVMGR